MINDISLNFDHNLDKEDNRLTFSNDYLDSDKYVSQFLNVEDLNLDIDEPIIDDPIVEILQTPIPKESAYQHINTLKEAKLPKKRSSFHNFQKHLVTTIRTLVDTSQIGKCPETAICERKLWKVFINSNKINKTLVSIIMGGDLTSENTSKVAEYGLLEIFEGFSCDEIKEAQKNLHDQVLCQLRSANLEDELTKRRMKHKKEFVVYFQAFLEELSNGNLEKRMAKCTKLLKNDSL